MPGKWWSSGRLCKVGVETLTDCNNIVVGDTDKHNNDNESNPTAKKILNTGSL